MIEDQSPSNVPHLYKIPVYPTRDTSPFRAGLKSTFPNVKVNFPLHVMPGYFPCQVTQNSAEQIFLKSFFPHDLSEDKNQVIRGIVEICFGRVFQELRLLGVSCRPNVFNSQPPTTVSTSSLSDGWAALWSLKIG